MNREDIIRKIMTGNSITKNDLNYLDFDDIINVINQLNKNCKILSEETFVYSLNMKSLIEYIKEASERLISNANTATPEQLKELGSEMWDIIQQIRL